MDNPLTRAEHNEFCKRMEDEHHRISRRLTSLENRSEQLNSLALSVQELAVSVKNMVEEQREQSERLGKLEAKDGEMWQKVITYTITTVIGIAIGLIMQGAV